MRWVLVVSVTMLSCATARSHFVTDAELEVNVSRFNKADAVVLLQRERTELSLDPGRVWTQSSRHEVIKVLKASVAPFVAEVPALDLADPVSFAARVKCPGAPEQRFDERALKPIEHTAAREFAFPPAAPGCALEYAWEFTAPGALPWNRSHRPGPYPVARAELELLLPPGARVEATAYNGRDFTRTQGNDGSTVLRFQAKNLPARSTEENAPHWTFTAPWWQWRLTSVVIPGRTLDLVRVLSTRVPYLRNWDDVVAQFARRFSSLEVVDGFTEKLDAATCSDVRCLAQRAVDLVQQHTRNHAENPDRTQNLAEAWRSGDASEVERALMVKALLEPLVPNVALAFGSAKLGRLQTPFPSPEAFDRLFVAAGPLIVDPNCEGCAVGTVPAQYAGTSFFVFGHRGRGAFMGVPTAPALEWVRTQHTATVDGTGALVDQLSRDTIGAQAAFEFQQLYRAPPNVLTQQLQLRLAEAVPTADVRQTAFSSCSLNHCVWNATVQYGAEPRRDGQRWRVPLRFLHAARERWLLPVERDTDMHLRAADDFEEVADVAAPPGFVLETVPAATRFTLGGFKMEVFYERTPDGARVTRRLAHGVEIVSRNDYARLHEALRSFRAVREQELVFAPKR